MAYGLRKLMKTEAEALLNSAEVVVNGAEGHGSHGQRFSDRGLYPPVSRDIGRSNRSDR